MNKPIPGTLTNNETESNVNTCCLGSKFLPIETMQQTADVYPYETSYNLLPKITIVTGATVWEDPATQQKYILIFH